MKTYYLYHTEAGYKCRVNIEELVFLFNIPAGAEDQEINNILIKYNYYVKNAYII